MFSSNDNDLTPKEKEQVKFCIDYVSQNRFLDFMEVSWKLLSISPTPKTFQAVLKSFAAYVIYCYIQDKEEGNVGSVDDV